MTGRETVAGQGASGDRGDPDSGPGMSGGQVMNVTPYLALVRELSALYVPVRMRPEFAVALDAEIRAAAREHYAEDFSEAAAAVSQHRYRDRVMGYLQPVSDRMDRRVVLGAAALGSAAAVSVSIAGLLAYAWRQRGRRAA